MWRMRPSSPKQSTGALTFFGKTAAMLQGGDEKSNLQKLLERIMIILSVLCFACSIAVFVVLLMEGMPLRWVTRRCGCSVWSCRF